MISPALTLLLLLAVPQDVESLIEQVTAFWKKGWADEQAKQKK
jgi:hypothetical protein